MGKYGLKEGFIMNEKEIKFYQHPLLVWFLLFVSPPLGILLLWIVGHYDILLRVVISLLFGLLYLEFVGLSSSLIRALIYSAIFIYVIYRQLRLQNYAEKVKFFFEKTVNNFNIQTIISSYIKKFTPPTYRYYDLLLFEIYLRKKYPVIYRNLSLVHKEDTYINIIYQPAKFVLASENDEEISQLLEKTEKQNIQYENNLIHLKTILSEKLGLKSEKFSLYFTLTLLKHFSLIYYAEEFTKNYGHEFKQLDLNDLILRYVTLDYLNTDLNSPDLACFTYYLIHNGVLTEEYDFYTAIHLIENNLSSEYQRRKEQLFEKHLLTSNNELLKEVETLDIVNEMKTKERFTIFVYDLLHSLGYENINSPLNKLLDLLVTLNSITFGVNIIFQEKPTVLINITKVHDLKAGLEYHKLNKGIIITNGAFTQESLELANKNNIILWDNTVLQEKAHFVRSHRDLTQITMETINLMTKQEFIYYMAELFKRKGYLIKTYDTLPSYGIDFIIEKNSLLFGVQVNNNYLVNSARIKSIISGIPYYQTQFGIVVSTKGFSDNAKMLALACNIILWDQEKTIEEVKKAQSAF